jgi:hypothetical protein
LANAARKPSESTGILTFQLAIGQITHLSGRAIETVIQYPLCCDTAAFLAPKGGFFRRKEAYRKNMHTGVLTCALLANLPGPL